MKTKNSKVIILSIFIIIFTLTLVGCDSPSTSPSPDDPDVSEEPSEMNIVFILEDEESGDFVEDADVIVEDYDEDEQRATYTEDGRHVLENISLIEDNIYQANIDHEYYQSHSEDFSAQDNKNIELDLKPRNYSTEVEVYGIMKPEHAEAFNIESEDGQIDYDFTESDYNEEENTLIYESEEELNGKQDIKLTIDNDKLPDYFYSIAGNESFTKSIDFNEENISFQLDDILDTYSEPKGSLDENFEIYLIDDGQIIIKNYSSTNKVELEDKVKVNVDGYRNIGSFDVSETENYIIEDNDDLIIDFSKLNLMDHRTENYGEPIEFKLFNESDNILGTLTVEVETINN